VYDPKVFIYFDTLTDTSLCILIFLHLFQIVLVESINVLIRHKKKEMEIKDSLSRFITYAYR